MAASGMVRRVVITAAFVLGLAPLVLGALLGPTLVFLAPFLTFSGACLISGSLHWFDEAERNALRARRSASAQHPAHEPRVLERRALPIS